VRELRRRREAEVRQAHQSRILLLLRTEAVQKERNDVRGVLAEIKRTSEKKATPTDRTAALHAMWQQTRCQRKEDV
jgi:hypothetical protein